MLSMKFCSSGVNGPGVGEAGAGMVTGAVVGVRVAEGVGAGVVVRVGVAAAVGVVVRVGAMVGLGDVFLQETSCGHKSIGAAKTRPSRRHRFSTDPPAED
jgi:hypothetical protein